MHLEKKKLIFIGCRSRTSKLSVTLVAQESEVIGKKCVVSELSCTRWAYKRGLSVCQTIGGSAEKRARPSIEHGQNCRPEPGGVQQSLVSLERNVRILELICGALRGGSYNWTTLKSRRSAATLHLFFFFQAMEALGRLLRRPHRREGKWEEQSGGRREKRGRVFLFCFKEKTLGLYRRWPGRRRPWRRWRRRRWRRRPRLGSWRRRWPCEGRERCSTWPAGRSGGGRRPGGSAAWSRCRHCGGWAARQLPVKEEKVMMETRVWYLRRRQFNGAFKVGWRRRALTSSFMGSLGGLNSSW